MAKPVVLTVDDDPDVLQAVARDLRHQYGDRYRIMRANSGMAALEAVEKLKLRNDSVALFLVDQRMPNMGGVEFLQQAKGIFPDAKKVLLTAYADTNAAIDSINNAKLDYYLLKPFDIQILRAVLAIVGRLYLIKLKIFWRAIKFPIAG